MKKKWITKAEITKILKTYSIRKNEFLPVGESEYFYQSHIVKGYTINISQDTVEAPNYFRDTGRIAVSHTQSNGKRTFVDIWERDQNGDLQFRFRNLWNQPFSDADYIKDLEKINSELKMAGKKLQAQLAAAKPNIIEQNNSRELINDTNTEEIENLRKQLNDLEEKYQKLKKDTQMHNARGAGRKPSRERLNAISQVKSLIESGHSDQDIMDNLGISRATFYRYKKSLNN